MDYQNYQLFSEQDSVLLFFFTILILFPTSMNTISCYLLFKNMLYIFNRIAKLKIKQSLKNFSNINIKESFV